jgi:hypothetical protein
MAIQSAWPNADLNLDISVHAITLERAELQLETQWLLQVMPYHK